MAARKHKKEAAEGGPAIFDHFMYPGAPAEVVKAYTAHMGAMKYTKLSAVRAQFTRRMREFFGLEAKYRVWSTGGGTEAATFVVEMCARMFAKHTGKLPHVVYSRYGVREVERACRRLSAEKLTLFSEVIDNIGSPEIRLEVMKQIRATTCLVAFPAIDSDTGVLADVRAIRSACTDKRVPLMLDVTLLIGQSRVNNELLKADVLVADFGCIGCPGCGMIAISPDLVTGFGLPAPYPAPPAALAGAIEIAGMLDSTREARHDATIRMRTDIVRLLGEAGALVSMKRWHRGDRGSAMYLVYPPAIDDPRYLPGILLIAVRRWTFTAARRWLSARGVEVGVPTRYRSPQELSRHMIRVTIGPYTTKKNVAALVGRLLELAATDPAADEEERAMRLNDGRDETPNVIGNLVGSLLEDYDPRQDE